MLKEYELQLAQQIMSANPGMTPEQAIAEVKGMPPGAQAGQYAGQQGMAQAGLNRQAQQQSSPLFGTGGFVNGLKTLGDEYERAIFGTRGFDKSMEELPGDISNYFFGDRPAPEAQAQAPQPCPTCGGTGVVGKSTDVNDSWPELNIKY